MTPHEDFLDRMRIASPCHVGWENMAGDDRKRFCDQCSLHVYNISAMTSDEVASLIESKDGRICARLYRRADGTVLTRDCPVGLRALRRRVSKAAGAALTALLSLCSAAFGQSKPQEGGAAGDAFQPRIKREAAQEGNWSAFAGTVLDAGGVPVTRAEVTLVNEQTKERRTAFSTPEGKFKFSALAAGNYSFEVKAANFKPRSSGLLVNSKEVVLADVTLEFEGNLVLVGLMMDTSFVIETKDEIKVSNGTTTIRGDIIQRLPLP